VTSSAKEAWDEEETVLKYKLFSSRVQFIQPEAGIHAMHVMPKEEQCE
jgi:hypothetical protein